MSSRLISAFAAASALAFFPSTALAQRQAPSPEQRLERLERQVQQVQRQVFPKGRPADTAGFSDEPAATQSSVLTLNQRLDALERQMAEMLRQSEENGNRLRNVEADVGKLRTDQEQRISAIEQRISAAEAAPAVAVPEPQAATPPATPKPKPQAQPSKGAKAPKTAADAPVPATAGDSAATDAGDPGEDAYSEGFRLWQAGNYDDAIKTLKAFTAAYPKHRRVSFANNLIGRALLDKGQPRAAAEALLANYRGNPGGDRAPDSLYYLGQALTKLGQPAQACKAYAELDAVYGAKVRPDLKKLVTDAEAQGQCS